MAATKAAAAEDLASVLKATKALHASQLAKLGFKNQEEHSMVEEIRTFMKRRAEIEYTYHEEIAKLCMQHQSARKTKPQSKEERPVNKAWVVFLEESRAYARSRGVFAEKLREELTNPMKPFLDDRRRSFAKSSEFGQKLQEGLQTTMADLIRAKATYEQCFKESEKASAKYEEAMRTPTGTLKKLVSLSTTKAKLDDARKKQKAASQKAQNARNEYLLLAQSYRMHQQTYDATCLPEWMKRIDGNFFEVLRRYYTWFAEAETQNAADLTTMMANVINAAHRINRDQDCADFVADNNPTFAVSKVAQLDLMPSDKATGIQFDDISKVILSNKLAQQMTRRDQLEAAIAQKQKEIDGVRRMTTVFDQTPSFGEASKTQDAEDDLENASTFLRIEKVKLDATIKMLTEAGVPVLAQPKKKEPKKAAAVKRCVALYDYDAAMPDDLTIRVNDVITIVEDGPEWIKGELNGQVGHFPASYVRKEADAADGTSGRRPSGKVMAVYDYTGEEGELSFRAGDVIEIVSKLDDDWWEGRLNGVTGSFPVVMVADHEEDDDGTADDASSGGSSGGGAGIPAFVEIFANSGPGSTMKRSASGSSSGSGLLSAGNTSGESLSRRNSAANKAAALAAVAATKPAPAIISSGMSSGTSTASLASLGSGTLRSGSTTSATSSASLVGGKPPMPPVAPAATAAAAAAAPAMPARPSVAPAPVAVAPTPAPASSSGKMVVKALYDYKATVEGELSFRKGDLIEVIDTDTGDDDWWEGRNPAGQEGQFPNAYVQKNPVSAAAAAPAPVAVAEPPKPKVKALYDYKAADVVELSIRAGDIIELISKTVADDHTGSWWEGRLNGKTGVFPKDYVQPI